MKLKPRAPENPEINLVPLIDVVLLLVVFFMLSSTFVEEGRVRILLPEANAAAAQRPHTPLIVTITQTGSYRVNERELVNSSPETLRAALLRVTGADRSTPVTLRADGRTTHQSVVTAMDVLGRLGFTEIDIATTNAPAGPERR